MTVFSIGLSVSHKEVESSMNPTMRGGGEEGVEEGDETMTTIINLLQDLPLDTAWETGLKRSLFSATAPTPADITEAMCVMTNLLVSGKHDTGEGESTDFVIMREKRDCSVVTSSQAQRRLRQKSIHQCRQSPWADHKNRQTKEVAIGIGLA